nr:MAG TPA: hypothetical protein [Caudoviricetes sp.]
MMCRRFCMLPCFTYEFNTLSWYIYAYICLTK